MIYNYPIAALSAAAFYAFLVLLFLKPVRARVLPILAHPVPPHQQYVRGFDSIRGLAAAYIALSHFWYFTYPVFDVTRTELAPFLEFGSKAVPIFCALSGFLIYRAALGIGSIDTLRAYIIRRLFRIYPVYVVSALLTLLFGQYVARFGSTAFAFAVGELFMFHSIGFQPIANPVTWSLYIEVVFYALMPMFVILVRRERVLFVAAALFVLMVASYSPNRVFGLWKYFVVGIVASELSDRIRYAWIAAAASGGGLVLLLFDIFGPRFDWAAHLHIMPKDVTGFTLGLALGIGGILTGLPLLKRAGQLLDAAPVRVLGAISYSLFLIHPFYLMANFPELGVLSEFRVFPTKDLSAPIWYLPLVFFPGVLAWSIVVFLLFERPGIKLGARLIRRSSTRGAAR